MRKIDGKIHEVMVEEFHAFKEEALRAACEEAIDTGKTVTAVIKFGPIREVYEIQPEDARRALRRLSEKESNSRTPGGYTH